MQSRPALKPALDCLLDLNRDYIRAVETSDVSRFAEILTEDFLCSQPDGSPGPGSILEANRGTCEDLESRSPRRQGPDHGRRRDHSRANHLHHAGRTARSGPLHGRVGTEERPMAGRLSPRYPLLRCANPLEPSFRVTPFSTQSIAAC